MNMILHNNPTAAIHGGQSTLAAPFFKDGDTLKTFDFVVANPPFSDKRWRTGLDPGNDPYERFKSFGTPPAKQGDYAYLLHIVRSLKSSGKGACILPHGVLFRGNVEADIRRNLVRMDAEIAALEAKLAKVLRLKQGMMQELLTGKIRLVDMLRRIWALPVPTG